MDILEKQVKFFNIFKETAANNIGLIQGFPNWVSKMSFTVQEDDLLIHIPPALVTYGTSDRISRSKKKSEADKIMKKKTYTYLEFVIKNACMVYASTIEKQVAAVGGFYKKGNGHDD